MKKNIICFVLIALSSKVFALTPEERAEQEKENMKILAGLGLPLPGSGIKVIPRSMLGLSEEQIKQGEKEAEEFKEKGYVNKYINRPLELLGINDSVVKKEIKSVANKRKDTYTGLSRKPEQLKLAFEFPSLAKNKNLAKFSSEFHALGAAPAGGFHKELGGWSGAGEFFTYKNIGTCDYIVTNVKASNAAIELAQEDVTYTINNKTTILMPVKGSENSGFLYSVKWYDDKNYHQLDCGNMSYSSDINEAVIELAKRIDSQ